MSGPHRADVIVIGAGIAGASAAYELASRASVVLVEAESQPGHHTTGRSAALLNSSVGDRSICDLATASRTFFESPPDGFCEHPLLSPRGLMWIAGAAHADALDALAAETAGVTTRLAADGARRIVPTLADAAVASGALHEPTAMTIDVASLLAGYMRGVARPRRRRVDRVGGDDDRTRCGSVGGVERAGRCDRGAVRRERGRRVG